MSINLNLNLKFFDMSQKIWKKQYGLALSETKFVTQNEMNNI